MDVKDFCSAMEMDHPQNDRFDEPQLIDALQKTGFGIESSRQSGNLYLWVVAVKDRK